MNKLLSMIPQPITQKACRLGLAISKRSPELLTGAGIVLGVGATVMACRSTLHVNEVLEKHKSVMTTIKDTSENKEEYPEYTEDMVRRDKYIQTVKTGVALVKLYSPAIILGGLSITAIVCGHGILMKRNAALAVAYAGIQKSFAEYRKRVGEELGEEHELELYRGVQEQIERTETKSGKVKETKTKKMISGYPYSIYARVFDETNPWFKKNNTLNKTFLQAQQAHANDLLRIRGHLFLNEVYRMLGFHDTKEGSIVGWIYGNGDSFVDFNVFNVESPSAVNFVNGNENAVWLDFNVDGVIYDLI